ncbi:MAG: hypothetical protein NC112_01225 [Oxalobacter formigenes]|nr:hypothetical protein [Oxalobacter formigenes]
MTSETCKCPVCNAPSTLNDGGVQCGGCQMTLPVDDYNRLRDRLADTARLDALVSNQWRIARRIREGNTSYLVNGWQSQYSNWHSDYRAAINEAMKIMGIRVGDE